MKHTAVIAVTLLNAFGRAFADDNSPTPPTSAEPQRPFFISLEPPAPKFVPVAKPTTLRAMPTALIPARVAPLLPAEVERLRKELDAEEEALLRERREFLKRAGLGSPEDGEGSMAQFEEAQRRRSERILKRKQEIQQILGMASDKSRAGASAFESGQKSK